MEIQEKATQVLDRQISDIQETIIQNKVDIADLYVKIHDSNPLLSLDVDDFISKLKDIDKMPSLLSKLAKNKAILESLTKSKTEIEQAYSGVLVK